jgi:flagellar basal body-associated protein FliL
MMKPAAQRRRSLMHWVMLILLVVLGLGTLVMIFSYLGRGGADDPLLDPMNNPNIRVADMM